MQPVIDPIRWEAFCERHQLVPEAARFALETCYYRLDIRARAGTLLVTDRELIHHSYNGWDTIFGLGERRIRVSVPLDGITDVERLTLSPGLRLVHGSPDAAFRIRTQDGTVHDFVLQRDGDLFERVLAQTRAGGEARRTKPHWWTDRSGLGG